MAAWARTNATGRSRCSWPTTTCSCARACGRCSALEPDLEVVGVGRRLRRARRRRRRDSRRRCVVTDIRMPPDVPGRGHRGGQAGAQAPPGHRRRGPVAVRRPRVRDLAARAKARPGTPTCSRTGSATATGSPGRSARSRPAARCSTPRSSQALVSPVRDDADLTADEDAAAARDRRGPAGEGDRGRPAARRPRRSNDAIEDLFLKLAAGRERRPGRRAAPAAPAAAGDRRPRGAGRDAQPAAPGRARREAARRPRRPAGAPSGSTSPC